jgi:hypothetical protein
LTRDLQTLLSLKRVLESAEKGAGISQAFVKEFAGAAKGGKESARSLLLGYPLKTSLSPLAGEGSEEISMLSALIIGAPRSSVFRVGKTGTTLATTLEGWIKARESRALEDKVMRFRGFVASAVLGAVTSMMASLGPVIGNLGNLLNTAAPAPVGGGNLLPAAAAMAAISSGMLGFYLSGRGLVLNLIVTLAVFAFVAAATVPLASISVTGP